VWLDRRLRDGWASVPFLVPTERLTLVDAKDPVLDRVPGTAFLHPAGLRMDATWSALPPAVRLEIQPGPLEQGDLAPAAGVLYVRVDAVTSNVAAETPLAAFEDGVLLAEADARVVRGPGSDELVIASVWGAGVPIESDMASTIRVADEDRVVVSETVVLGSGLYGAPRWRPGDRIVEHHRIRLPEPFDPARHRVWLGVTEAPGGVPAGAGGAASDGFVELSVTVPSP
jgi:hypothetical protein